MTTVSAGVHSAITMETQCIAILCKQTDTSHIMTGVTT